ncbi:putative polyketide synthase [Mycena venus]|uniref:Putative polyketide synthase n=1 Tax=Mycena venus TaxID=2733690 RepID=A0A8H6YL21_9AGAR|nr:putative polyketide synthase [Mycena venus]
MSRPIAIVGISADLPSGAYSDTNLDHTSFFNFLLNSGEAYETIPSTRFNIDAWKGSGLGQISTEKGSFLKDIDLFDHVEFGISSRDARAMSPATRKLLEHSFLALLDSGIDYRKALVGCYMSGTSIELSNVANPDEYEPHGSFARMPAMIANRISNHLDLLGPSIPVDTACSSSLTALHIAVQALQLGDCKAAVVGGCQLNHRLIDWINYSQSAVLSSDGKCKPFDASADGFGRAEGCVAIVIKPLEDALQDQDRIYATILGTAVNSTGSGGPPGAPVAESQAQAMKGAFERAARNPSDVAYVEVHATGTAKGDPTEVNWVGQNFRRPSELMIGSVKGNIGHTEITAFLASLSKVLSIFEHKIIPPNVNLSTPNPAIKWREYNLCVLTRPTPLPSMESAGKTLIAMSSSGIGGSNGHVVLEAPPEPTCINQQSRGIDRSILLLATGLSPRSVSAIAAQISDVFDTAPASEYAAISTVLGRRAKQMNWRSYAVAVPSRGAALQFSSPQYCARDVNPIVFVFSGQGPQHESMGRELFSTFPAFRESILDMDAVFQRRTNKSMVRDYGLFGAASSSFEFPRVWPIALTGPAIAMFQIALFDLLVHLGVAPDIVLGHSAGETSVLYASGAAPRALAVELAIIRGQILSTLEASGGTMAAVSCTPQEIEKLLTQYRADNPDSIVELACINSPSAVAISGLERSVDGILQLAQQEGIFGQKIRTRVPIHSSMVEVCQQQYEAEVRDLFARYPGRHVPKIRTYSTLTGGEFHDSFDAEYFWRNTRAQVLFAPAIFSIGEVATFVEISPHPVLSSYLFEMAASSSSVLSLIRRPKTGSASTEYHDTLEFFGKLTAAGHNCVNFTLLNAVSCSASKVKLPAYPFLKKQFPLLPDTSREDNHYHGPVNRAHLRLNRDTHPTLAEHVIRGEPIWPAAGFLEMALEFGATTLFNVNFRAMLPLSAEDPIPVNVILDGSYWKITSSILEARGRKGSADSLIERVHADGYLSSEDSPEYGDLNISEIRERCDSHVDSELYPSLSYFSSYGPKFQRATNLYYNANEALAAIRGMDGSLANEHPYILHPAVLDACFHIATYRGFHGDFAPNNYYLPSRIGEMILHAPPKAGYFPLHVYTHVELVRWMPDSIHFNMTIVDDLGKRLCTLRNFEVAKHQISPHREISAPLHIVTQSVFHRIKDSKTTVHLTEPESFLDFNDSDVNDPPITTAFIRTGHRLRNTISALTANHAQRVVRICVFGDVDLDVFLSRFREILGDFPQAAFELSIPESCTAPDDADELVMAVRRENPVNAGDFFDIVVSFGREASSVDFNIGSHIADCDHILLPGGTLLLTEVNHTALSGTDSGPSTLDGPPTFGSSECKMILAEMGYSIVNTDSFPVCDPLHLIIDAQKATWKSDATDQSSLPDEDAFIFTYKFGEELQLQWEFSGLNPAQELDVWIIALEGTDAGASLCLTRALRREYLFWNIRFASFPSTFSKERQMNCLHALPFCMKAEPDVVFSPNGDPRVPRLVPLVPQPAAKATSSLSLSSQLDREQAVVQIHCASTYPTFSAFIASVIQANPDTPEYRSGTPVVGLQLGASGGRVTVDLRSVVPACQSSTAECVPGIVASVLGLGLSTWNRSHRITGLSILITHCDTAIGSTVCEIYLHEGFKVSKTPADATVLDLARMGYETFDLIISGYEDKIHAQDPCSLGDALRVAVSKGFLDIASRVSSSVGAMFDSDKTYVLLGGIGSLGASVAVYMVQHGARHIVVTSRSGKGTLLAKKNLISRRIFAYLESLEYVDIRLQAVDGACPKSMRALFDSIGSVLGGCLILSGILADGLFPTLGSREFSTVAASKTGVLKTLQETIDTSTLDFIIVFSSVTSVFGTGGQTNYCAANGALEEQMLAMPNGFAFICPGILDSAFILSEGGPGSRLKHLIEWSISTDEMLMWLDDAIVKYQSGGRFQRYLPNLNWEALDRTHGMPKLGVHLVHSSKDVTEVQGGGEVIVAKAARIIQNVLNISEEDFDADVPLTFYGIDSLLAGRLSFALRSLVKVTQLQLLADISLSGIIRKFLQSSCDSGQAERIEVAGTNSVPTTTLMDDWVRKFTAHYLPMEPNPVPTLDHSTPEVHTVLLTGTTGALGCHLLAHLLANASIRTVYALNRENGDGGLLINRQAAALQKQGLSPALARSEKLVLLIGDLGEVDFGISAEMMVELRSSVTHIIHNAWRVDFVARLGEFENLIVGTNRLLQFAIQSERPVRPTFSFISTIGVSRNFHPSASTPKAPIEDARITVQSGYLESKFVGERLVQMASQQRYLNANVIRVGQLTGSTVGTWETTQWFPALIQSGVHVGCLPDGNDVISWIPINDAAAAIVDMRSSMNETFHLIHPRPTTWRAVMEPLASMLHVPLVPYVEWFARLKSTAEFSGVHGTEALKLLDFLPTRAETRGGLGKHGAAPESRFATSGSSFRNPQTGRIGPPWAGRCGELGEVLAGG